MIEDKITFSRWPFHKDLQPIEWLQYIADEFSGIADLWDEYNSNYFEDKFEEYKEECPDISKIDMYSEIANGIYGDDCTPLHDYTCDTGDVAHEIEYFHKTILMSFENSTVFQNLLNAIGIIDNVIEIAKEAEDSFFYYQYYPICSTQEEARQWFGNHAAKRFDKERELTIEDYETAFECITELLETIEKRRFAEKLRDSSYAIKAYCKLKVGSEKYAEIEADIAEAKRRGHGKLNNMVGDILKTSPNMKSTEIAELINKTSNGVNRPTTEDSVRKTQSWINRPKKNSKRKKK